jgi:hypothetical protein
MHGIKLAPRLCCALAAGDMPVALMVDGPSLGGFVCPATITSSELWKMGQVRPGDSVCFIKQTIGEVRGLAGPLRAGPLRDGSLRAGPLRAPSQQ